MKLTLDTLKAVILSGDSAAVIEEEVPSQETKSDKIARELKSTDKETVARGEVI